MNQSIEKFARQSIIDGLRKLEERHQERFKLMYGRHGGARSVEEAKAMSIDDVVNEIPGEHLNWALTQVENSVKKVSETSTGVEG